MKTVERTVYIANDGREFFDEEECRKHETFRELIDYVEPKVEKYDLSVDEVIQVLLERYAIIPRTTYVLYLEAVASMHLLMRESAGVAGLHRNGDVASWDSLRRGGEFEHWLGGLDDLLEVVTPPEE